MLIRSVFSPQIALCLGLVIEKQCFSYYLSVRLTGILHVDAA